MDAELRNAHAELQRRKAALEQGSGSIEAVGEQLTALKFMLAERELIYPQGNNPERAEALAAARDILEIGALWSIRARDLESFDRYWSQLRPFYVDLGELLPKSENFEPVVGLSLLRLLSSNAVSAFHIAIETLPPQLVRESPYIQHPVLLERWLMEGSYSNVWRERKNVPSAEYLFFIDQLIGTIRHEIALCEERAYNTLPLNDVATLLFFDNLPEVLEFAQERGWQVNPTSQMVEFANKKTDERAAERGADPGALEDKIPRRATITSSLQFAKELESIV
ncbi:regulatory particle non-ATPase [Malassezia cuniculi]|uniref:Regulatory particle non-ATPase n=1 Tax=Malassezia cuniculi TaxID=948313 RepID=A0AAF0J5J5_9BASI|nr:regulatory particle non-ATPase [Malassezia cuniculi]